MTPPRTFVTARLHLRPPTQADAAFIYSYASREDVARYMMWPRHTEIGQTHGFLERCERVWAEASAFPWLLENRATGVPIGMIEVHLSRFKANVGYVLHPDFWGQGYTTEALVALRDWSLAQDEIYRFWSYCDVDNRASARVMEKAGMQFEGILRRWVRHPNISAIPRDARCYAVVK